MESFLKFSFFMAFITTTFMGWADQQSLRGINSTPDDDFSESLSLEPANGSETFEVYLKFTVFLNGAGQPQKIYYQSPEKYERHADFLTTRPEFKNLTAAEIDALTYRNNGKRRAFIGVLTTRSGDDGVQASRFNLVTEETPSAAVIEAVRNVILQSNKEDKLPGVLKFEFLDHQVSGASAVAEELRHKGVPIHVSKEARSAVPYTDAWAVGTLEWIGSEDELISKVKEGKINATTIVVTDQNLREFPRIAGLISAVRLTPASHSVLLAQMYDMPVVYMKDAADFFRQLQGRRLFLNSANAPGSFVSEQRVDFLIDPTQEDLNILAQFKVRPQLKVTLDMSQTQVRLTRELDLSHVSSYGGKASQMGMIMSALPQNSVEQSAAIPISAFKNFLSLVKAPDGRTLESWILSQLASIPEGAENTPRAAEILKSIRKAIKAAEIPAVIIDPIRRDLLALFPGPSVRLKIRSSSNVEDGSEFNGAGLYDSKGAWLTGGDANDLEKTLKAVWASLYTDRGFTARRQFQVDEHLVGMGLLVHPPFKNEIANGLAEIFMSVKDVNSAQVRVVSYQGEEMLATHATGEVSPEIVKVSNDFMEVEQALQGYTKERTVLRKNDYISLNQMMRKLARLYANGKTDVHIESEWKLSPDSKGEPRIFIKQVRRVPKPMRVAARDGSRFRVLAPKLLRLGQLRSTSGNAFLDNLFRPQDVSLQMRSFTEKDLQNGKIQIDQVDFTVQGAKYSIANPKISIESESAAPESRKNLKVFLPNAHFPSLNLNISLHTADGNAAYTLMDPSIIYYMSTSSDLNFLNILNGDSKLESAYLAIPQNATSASEEEVYTKVDGEMTFFVNTATKEKIIVVAKEIKSRGEGDSREMKIGRATVFGILPRPIELNAAGIAVGANHHSGMESFVFDLTSDQSLTDRERQSLLKKYAQYLYLNANSFYVDPSGEVNIAYLLKNAKGDSFKSGTWESKEGAHPPVQSSTSSTLKRKIRSVTAMNCEMTL